MHRIPPKSEAVNRQKWLVALNLTEGDVLEHHRICSRHFRNGDTTQIPSLHLGARFASPKKVVSQRCKTSRKRKNLSLQYEPAVKQPNTSTKATHEPDAANDTITSEVYSTPVGEALLTDYCLHELPTETISSSDYHHDDTFAVDGACSSTPVTAPAEETQGLVHAALTARIEFLEAKNKSLTQQLALPKAAFRLADIEHNDVLIRFYTGFPSYEILLFFYEFLGPAVHRLQYWGSKTVTKHHKKKLDPFNQLFLTLIKLRLNLKERDLSERFGISVSSVSKYFITWICFLYHHLTEIDWMPTVSQVKATLPHAFKEKYPNTYVIIDASEFFLETPSDLRLQSSTWSNYKHHNTAKLLIACTPNGAISYISSLYVGSISDVELTRVSGLISKLPRNESASVMADRGFTIRDQLNEVGVELNIPPFLEGQKQLPSSKVQEGRTIASLRIHVERAIGRVKNYTILKSPLPLSMSCIANQIFNSVCFTRELSASLS